MSFSANLKNELCSVDINCNQQAYYEILGIFLFSNYIKSNSIYIMSNSKPYICRIISLLKTVNIIGNDCNIYKEEKYRKQYRYFIDIKDNKIIKRISKFLNFHDIKNNIQNQFLSDFIRGIFLSCGNISNPSLNYHLEFIIHNVALINSLVNALASIKSFRISASNTLRRNTNVVYIKGSENIVDLLTFMGAPKSSMNFIQTKMIHEFRNYINRTNNFETANISKTTLAASVQINAIKKIKKSVGLDNLPDSLREIAELRLSNPYMSLNELCSCLPIPISRSGINHRLKRIVDISQKIE